MIAATGGEPSILAAKATTSTIPLLFITGGDPVKLGIVTSLNRPGGNATGVSTFFSVLGPKRLALLQELVPKIAAIGVLANPTFAYTEEEMKDVLAAGRALDKQILITTATTESEIDAAFASLVERRVDALMLIVDPFFVSRRGRFIALAAHYAVPVMYFSRDFAADGGLISYGPNLAEAYHQVGVYAGQILKGAKPANLPVLQPTKFELMINLKTAKALGLSVPPTLLAIADEAIE